MPGASAPAATCAAKSTRVSNHEYAETPGIPAHNGFTVYSALPGDEFVLSPSSAN